MEQSKQLELGGILSEDIEKKNIVEKAKNNEVDESILQKVVDEMLEEKNQDDIIKQGFFWRAVYLYTEKMGVKMNKEEIEEIYKKIKPELIKILDLKKIKYKLNVAPIKKQEPEDWYRRSEEKLERLNDRGPRT
ncbi:MAG: hypothetical protein V1801_00810 [Candidatus Falkowbacteria bacterium]